MANDIATHGRRLLDILDRLSKAGDTTKYLKKIISDDADSNADYGELHRMHTALKTYLATDRSVRYVAFVGLFSSGKTATINNLLGIRGTKKAFPEDTNPTTMGLTLCVHESRKASVYDTLIEADWKAEKFFHDTEALSDVVLIDTQGKGDPEIRTDIVRNFMPICDMIVYCFNGTNPLNEIDVPLVQELNEVLQHMDFFYVYTRADDVYKKTRNELFSLDNFDKEKAERHEKIFFKRLKDALPNPPAREPELAFIGNDYQSGFGIEELRDRIRATPEDLRSRARRKLLFFRDRSLGSVSGLIKRVSEINDTVKNLLQETENNLQKSRNDFEIGTEEIKKFWADALSSIASDKRVALPADTASIGTSISADALRHAAVIHVLSGGDIERIVMLRLQSLFRILDRTATEAFEDWKKGVCKRLQSGGLECLGDNQVTAELSASVRVQLSVARSKDRFYKPGQDLIDKISYKIFKHINKNIVNSCNKIKKFSEETEKHAVVPTIFKLEREWREKYKDKISSIVGEYARVIEVYLSGVNTFGTMLLIKQANLEEDIDFLQQAQISGEETRATAGYLFSELLGTKAAELEDIEKRCMDIPQELGKRSADCETLRDDVDDLLYSFSDARPALSEIWDGAIEPLVARYEARQAEQREIIISDLMNKYKNVLGEFQSETDWRISVWKQWLWIAAGTGAAFVILSILSYYHVVPGDYPVIGPFIAAATALLSGAIVSAFKLMKSKSADWNIKSRHNFFQKATAESLEVVERVELAEPDHLSEAQSKCHDDLVQGFKTLTESRSMEIIQRVDALIAAAEAVRVSGVQIVEGYQKDWDAARRITQGLYLQTSDKVDKFKSVATGFRARTIDRTMQVFRKRADELENFCLLLKEDEAAMRNIE